MSLWQIDDQAVKSVWGALSYFERMREIGSYWTEHFPDLETLDPWFTPLQGLPSPNKWLATLIVRGALVTDVRIVMEKIEDIGEFGSLNGQGLEKYIEKRFPETKKFELVRDPTANLSCRDLEPDKRDYNSPVVAFWLPYDLGPNITAEDAYKDFDDKVFIPLEDLFFRFFGLAKNLKRPNEMLPASLLQQSAGRTFKGKWNN